MDFYATDLDGDGRQEILLAHWDYHLYVPDNSGNELSRTDIKSVPGGCGTGPYYVSVLPIPDGQRKLPVVGSWNRMPLPKVEANISDPQNWMSRIDDSWPKDSGIRENIDLNGNGIPDLLMHGCHGPIVVSERRTNEKGEVSFRQISSFQSLDGTYYYCDLFKLSSDPRANVIPCVRQNGVAALKLTPAENGGIEFDEVFRLPINPVSCYDLGDVDGDGYDDIVFGKLDGYVFMVDNNGQVLAHTLAADQVWAVQLLRARGGQMIVAVAVDDDLAVYDTQLNPLARTSVGRITALDCVPGEAEDDLVIFGATRWMAARVKLPVVAPQHGQ